MTIPKVMHKWSNELLGSLAFIGLPQVSFLAIKHYDSIATPKASSKLNTYNNGCPHYSFVYMFNMLTL
jgi:hypothetical protein